jgi:hypothetical protein
LSCGCKIPEYAIPLHPQVRYTPPRCCGRPWPITGSRTGSAPGAWGEVFRVEDTRLGRDVALKVLLPEFARDQERLRRFRREAQLLAALDHPGIVTIFSVEEVDGVPQRTMKEE